MIILGIDTSTQFASVALVRNHQIQSQNTYSGKLSISQKLLGMIHECLATTGTSLDQVDAFAAARGPGSFTGLRLGIATAMGLAMAAKKPVVGVETLLAMAFTAPPSKHLICPWLDARKKEIYGAAFKLSEGKLDRVMEDVAEPPETFLKRMKEEGFFFGNGAEIHKEKIESHFGGKNCVGIMNPHMASAGAVGLLATQQLENSSEGGDTFIEPKYIRRCEAEINKETKN